MAPLTIRNYYSMKRWDSSNTCLEEYFWKNEDIA